FPVHRRCTAAHFSARRRAAEPVLPHLVDQRDAAGAEPPSRLGLVSEGGGERAGDEVPLEGLGLLAEGEASVHLRGGVLLGWRWLELGRLQGSPGRERGEARDAVLELPDVARPIRVGETRDQLRAEPEVVEAELLGAAARQLLGERRDVLAPLAQR